ncbi:MAG: hypothetical protein V4664_01170 [Patescibacteria group bacterium]
MSAESPQEEASVIESTSEVQNFLEDTEKSNLLIVHRTHIDSVQKITFKLDGIDDYLVDQAAEGKITQWGLPAKFILGYINAGKLILNPRYTNE